MEKESIDPNNQFTQTVDNMQESQVHTVSFATKCFIHCANVSQIFRATYE